METYPRINDDQALEIATKVLQGLLASGHYTRGDKGDGLPGVITEDLGREWRDTIYCKRNITVAVSDALDIASELLRQIGRAHV